MMLVLHAGIASSFAHEISTRTWIDAHGVRWTETTEPWTGDRPGVGRRLEAQAGDQPHGDSDADARFAAQAQRGDRLLGSSPPYASMAGSAHHDFAPIAHFGPFVVLDSGRALLSRETDTSAPRHFARMLAAYPGIRTLEFRDCPGTVDDNANLVLGQMIHQRGLATFVPPGGSVRSGAVDLFLAGVERTAAADSEFAVHAWLDEDGLRPTSFSASSPVNRRYVTFYHEAGGMPLGTARAFYALTNSVPNERALWLTPYDLARYADITVQ